MNEPNAFLEALVVDAGEISPALGRSGTRPSVRIPHHVEQVVITATPADPAASIAINGQAVKPEEPSPPIPLEVGRTIIPI